MLGYVLRDHGVHRRESKALSEAESDPALEAMIKGRTRASTAWERLPGQVLSVL